MRLLIALRKALPAALQVLACGALVLARQRRSSSALVITLTLESAIAAPATTEVGLVRGGSQSNGRPWGDRDTEGFVEAPELQLRAPGMELTILSIVSAAEAITQGAAGTQSIVTVAEELRYDDWNGGELRLVSQDYSEPIVDTDATVRAGHASVLRCMASATATVTFDTTTDRVLWGAHGRRAHDL